MNEQTVTEGHKWKFGVFACLLLALGAAGCARMEPFEPAKVDEVPPGPGLFTGEKGAFYVVGAPDDATDREEGKGTAGRSR